MMRPVNNWYCAAECTTMSPWHGADHGDIVDAFAVCGNRSDTSMPLLPYFLNVRLVPSSVALD